MQIIYSSSVLSCAIDLYMVSLVIYLTFIYMSIPGKVSWTCQGYFFFFSTKAIKILELYFIIPFQSSLIFVIGFYLKCAITKNI